MKTIKLILYISALFPVFACAQNTKPVNKISWAIVDKNNGEDILTKDLIIDVSQIDDLKALNAEQISKRYPGLNSNIVLLVTLKPAAKMVTLNEFYANHKISLASQRLPISADGSKVKDPATAMFDENSIQDVKVESDSLRIMTHSWYKRAKAK